LNAPRVFDMQHYQTLNPSRAAAVNLVLTDVRRQQDLKTAADVGCGLGYFSGFLDSLGLLVRGVDGRNDNVEEASRRFPHISFRTIDAEADALRALGTFDVVLCFGLLYHLENPFRAIRNLHAMTSKLLLVESVVFPGSEPIMALIDEEPNDDQGLHHIAFYPTEACLVKLLYRAGFPNVYRFSTMPEHPDFRPTANVRQVRTMLAASEYSLATASLELMVESHIAIKPWDAASGAKEAGFFDKLRRFVDKPLPEKVESLKRRLGSE
jgi:SAM-dependent methyltransferase